MITIETRYIDSNLAGLLVCELVTMRATELLPDIKRLFDTGLVDIGCCGDYAAVKKGMLTGIGDHDSTSVDICERYGYLREMARGNKFPLIYWWKQEECLSLH